MTRRTTTSPVARTRAAALAITALAGLALTACGDDSSDSADDPSAGETSSSSQDPTETPTEEPSETPTEPAGPACADVWVAGETLPENYNGCQDEAKGTWVQAMIYHCSSGQRLVTYTRFFYAAKGEVINQSDVPLARNQDFQKVLASCGA